MTPYQRSFKSSVVHSEAIKLLKITHSTSHKGMTGNKNNKLCVGLTHMYINMRYARSKKSHEFKSCRLHDTLGHSMCSCDHQL